MKLPLSPGISILLMVNLALGGGLYWELVLPSSAEIVTPEADVKSDSPDSEVRLSVSLPLQGTFSEISSRPVFTALRRPRPPTPIAPTPALPLVVPPPPSTPMGFTLMGVIAGQDRQLALLKAATSPTTLTVAVGDMVSEWQVAQILADRIVLRAGSREYEVKFLTTLDDSSPRPDAAPMRQPAPFVPVLPGTNSAKKP